MNLRVTIDATPVLLRSAGVKTYVHHWVRHLRRQADLEIRAFPFLRDFEALEHEASMLGPLATLPRLGLVYWLNQTGYPPLDLLVQGADIVHASNMLRRAPRRAKLTATLHDLTCWLMPQLHTRSNVRADENFAEAVLRRADGLIAVSENTRQDAIRLLGIAPEKIETIHSGVAPEYFDAQPARRARPYVLYVGAIEPRKNLNKLLDAWKRLRPEHREAFELVVAGPLGWGSQKTLARVRAEATYLGYVPEADLPGLVAGAAAFAYPSLYEGFGFPVAQAMAAGVPVLTSNTSSLPEIAGDAALLADPRSTVEIANGLARLLDSESLRRKLGERGRARARQFSWETCAARSLAFFRRIAG
ncbi:MAG TPA: glycosyltransferase family 1 protein [Bryobacteraceae bacterium]|nr:glycosyltransferase family 1 protein [Bryobacteraceae bacterium]